MIAAMPQILYNEDSTKANVTIGEESWDINLEDEETTFDGAEIIDTADGPYLVTFESSADPNKVYKLSEVEGVEVGEYDEDEDEDDEDSEDAVEG